MKVRVVLDKKGKVLAMAPQTVKVFDAEKRGIVGEVQVGVEPADGEVLQEIELPKDWNEWPHEEILERAERLINKK